VKISNLKIDCTDQTGTTDAIRLTTCTDCELTNLWIHDARSSAVILFSSSSRNLLRDIRTTQSSNTGGTAILLDTDCSDNRIESCRVQDNGTAATEYGYKLNLRCHRNKITDCHAYSTWSNGFACSGNGTGNGSNENVFTNCVSEYNGRVAASTGGFRTRFHSIGNQFINCIARKGGATSASPGAQDGFTVQLGSHYTKFIGCKAYYNEGYGFSLKDADYCSLSGCEAVGNQDPGIRMEDCYFTSIVGCQSSNNGGVGIGNEALAATNKSFLASDWTQVGAGVFYYAASTQINDSAEPVVRLDENGRPMRPVHEIAFLSASASASTVLSVEDSSVFTAGETVVVTNLYNESLNTVTTVSSVDSATQITVADAQTGEVGEKIIRLSGSNPSGTVNSCYYIDRKAATPRVYVALSDLTAPGDNEITAGNGINYGNISQNTCIANGSSGILMEASSYNTVQGNTCLGNGTRGSGSDLNGIWIKVATTGGARSDYNTITGNNCSEFRASSPTDDRQQLYGIRLDDNSCDYNLVQGNTCVNNKTDQISFQTISGNVAKDNIINTTGLKGADIASAATITLPVTGDYFDITGTADITSITASWPGRLVTLQFDGTAATSGLVDGSNLKLASTLAYTPDDTITLRCDGTNWHETGRSVN
jgi:parallel beta-helix repeat protein